jgi:hypothetical protein
MSGKNEYEFAEGGPLHPPITIAESLFSLVNFNLNFSVMAKNYFKGDVCLVVAFELSLTGIS